MVIYPHGYLRRNALYPFHHLRYSRYQRRGAEPWWMRAVISVVPVAGLLVYVILRPSSYLIDRE